MMSQNDDRHKNSFIVSLYHYITGNNWARFYILNFLNFVFELKETIFFLPSESLTRQNSCVSF